MKDQRKGIWRIQRDRKNKESEKRMKKMTETLREIERVKFEIRNTRIDKKRSNEHQAIYTGAERRLQQRKKTFPNFIISNQQY